MKIIFLGTNGWYDTDTGNTTSILVDTAGAYIILDAGGGFYKIGKYIKEDKPVYLFLSHLHLDHIIGLHTLPLFSHRKGIDIYIPGHDSIQSLKAFLETPYTTPFSVLSAKTRIYNIEEIMPSGLDVALELLYHPVPCYGYRFYVEGKTIVYCTDTGVCDNLKKLASNADILITECALSPGETSVLNPYHLNPENSADIADRYGVKKLLLMHFDPGRYPRLKDRKIAERSARAIFKNTFAAQDGYEVKL